MTSDNWIQTRDLCRYYRRGPQEIRAVDGVDLNISKGEAFGVVGASGSGKSTLLNLLAGLDTPTGGKISIGGRILGDLTRKELARYRAEKVGMVFQSFNLIPHYTAIENVALGLIFNDIPRPERMKKAGEVLDRLGLSDRLDHRPADLSGGEQQRVAMARALVKNPEILFADEPTGNLDHDNTVQIAELLTELNRGGLTIIMVSHDVTLAERCTRRKVRMHYGKIEAVAT